MKTSSRVITVLREVGATLKRANRHLVYQLPNGQMVTIPQTPSDGYRGEKNSIRDIRHRASLPRGEVRMKETV